MENLRLGEKATYGDAVFVCPKCGGNSSRVIDSRPAFKKLAIRRRRACRTQRCRYRYTTYEVTETAYNDSIVRDRAFREWMVGLVRVIEKVKPQARKAIA